jgi:voltage-gated potassium channel
MKQPDKFENIGQSLWWSVATLTTVGYGIFAITGLGNF